MERLASPDAKNNMTCASWKKDVQIELASIHFKDEETLYLILYF